MHTQIMRLRVYTRLMCTFRAIYFGKICLMAACERHASTRKAISSSMGVVVQHMREESALLASLFCDVVRCCGCFHCLLPASSTDRPTKPRTTISRILHPKSNGRHFLQPEQASRVFSPPQHINTTHTKSYIYTDTTVYIYRPEFPT